MDYISYIQYIQHMYLCEILATGPNNFSGGNPVKSVHQSLCVQKVANVEMYKTMWQTHMQHEFGVSVDEFDQSEKEALVTSSVQICGFLFELKAGGHLPFECQTLWEVRRQRRSG